jgi:hypothetical protein
MVRPFLAWTATIVMFGLAWPGEAAAGLHAGDIAPDFRGTDLTGVSRTLFQYRGTVVVLFVLGNT